MPLRVPELLSSRVASVGLFLLGLLFGSAQAATNIYHERQLSVFGDDGRVPVPDPSAKPYAAVGLLHWSGDVVCTAVLVAESFAVTAADCVLLANGSVHAPDASPTVVVGSAKASVIKMHKQSDYWVQWTTNTYVLLELDAPLGKTVGTIKLPQLSDVENTVGPTAVQLVGFDADGGTMEFQTCMAHFPSEFDGPAYLLHHDCDTSSLTALGSPLLVNYSDSETYMLGLHMGSSSSPGGSTTFTTYSDDTANRGVLTPYIQQQLSSLLTQASSSGSTSSLDVEHQEKGSAEIGADSSSDPEATAKSSSSFISRPVGYICIAFVGLAWAAIVFIAVRRRRRGPPSAPGQLLEPLE